MGISPAEARERENLRRSLAVELLSALADRTCLDVLERLAQRTWVEKDLVRPYHRIGTPAKVRAALARLGSVDVIGYDQTTGMCWLTPTGRRVWTVLRGLL